MSPIHRIWFAVGFRSALSEGTARERMELSIASSMTAIVSTPSMPHWRPVNACDED